MERVIKEIIECYNVLEERERKLIDLFNDVLSSKCSHSNPVKEKDTDIFMNYKCDHKEGDGHCCIVRCPIVYKKEDK